MLLQLFGVTLKLPTNLNTRLCLPKPNVSNFLFKRPITIIVLYPVSSVVSCRRCEGDRDRPNGGQNDQDGLPLEPEPVDVRVDDPAQPAHGDDHQAQGTGQEEGH